MAHAVIAGAAAFTRNAAAEFRHPGVRPTDLFSSVAHRGSAIDGRTQPRYYSVLVRNSAVGSTVNERSSWSQHQETGVEASGTSSAFAYIPFIDGRSMRDARGADMGLFAAG